MERIEKPWGWYEEVFSETMNYKTKRLYVNPESKFSLQTHENRNEYWIVVQGDGYAIIGDNERKLKVGDLVFIPRTSQHRLIGADTGITIIEVQIGDPCVEDDIIRFEDDYGRV